MYVSKKKYGIGKYEMRINEIRIKTDFQDKIYYKYSQCMQIR